MATEPMPDGILTIFNFELNRGIPLATNFSILVDTYGLGGAVHPLEPALRLNSGAFAALPGEILTLPANVTKFAVRAKFPPMPKGYGGVRMRLQPLTNLSHFRDTSVLTNIGEFIPNRDLSDLILAGATARTMGEGASDVLDFTIEPGVLGGVFIKVDLIHESTSPADLLPVRYSFDNATYTALPLTGVIPVGDDVQKFYVQIRTATDTVYTEPDETFRVVITEYVAPEGTERLRFNSPITVQYTITDPSVPPFGYLLGTRCDEEKNKIGIYADGFGGQYENQIEYHSADCGYVIPPAGTLLRSFCAGFHKMGHYADGNDGYYLQAVAYNSVDCGFEIGIPNDQDILTPTRFDAATKGTTVTLEQDNRMFTGERRDAARTLYAPIFGKWYFEVEIYIPHDQAESIAIGLMTTGHNMGSWIGSDSTSWGWWPHTLTKHFSDIQNNYGLEVHDGDVVSVKLDMMGLEIELLLNGVSMGVMYTGLTDAPMHFIINANQESYAYANFGNLAFKYAVPEGYYPGFGVLHNPPPAKDTLLSTFCTGVDQWGMYANGKFGTYSKLIKKDSTDCGWIPPSPAYGTILSYFCKGLDRWVNKSDGNYGSFEELYSINSTSCGYVPPPTPTFTPATLNHLWLASTTSLSTDRLEALLDGSVRATNSVYSGKWYWEILVDDPDIIVGIGLETASNPDVVGYTNASWGWSISTGELYHNDQAGAPRSPYGMDVEPAPGDIIGVWLDFVAETLRFSYNGVDLGIAFTALTDIYFPMVSDLTGPSPHVTVKFGQTPMTYPPPAEYIAGYGVAATIRPRKGVIQSYYCVGTVRWVRRADGNGGTYNELFQVNSSACGWVPPLPAGQLISKFCVGVDQWGKYADGNYGSYDELIAIRSEACGYLPAGRLISSQCIGFDKWGTFSDGEFGTYVELMQSNSAECGFGSGGGGGGVNPPSIDPNLPNSPRGGLLFDQPPLNDTGLLIFDELLPVPPPPTHMPPGVLLGTGCLDGYMCNVYSDGVGGSYYMKVTNAHPDCVEWITSWSYDAVADPLAKFDPVMQPVSGSTMGTIAFNASKQAAQITIPQNAVEMRLTFSADKYTPSVAMRMILDMELVNPPVGSGDDRYFGVIFGNTTLDMSVAYRTSSHQTLIGGFNRSIAITTGLAVNPGAPTNVMTLPGRQTNTYLFQPDAAGVPTGGIFQNNTTIRMIQGTNMTSYANLVPNALRIASKWESFYLYGMRIEHRQNKAQTFTPIA